MARRIFTPEMGNASPGIVRLQLKFYPNGASAINQATVTGATKYVSVAYTSTGLFTFTFADSYPSLVGAFANIAMVSATDIKPQWGAIDVLTAKTAVLRTLAVATPTDIAADAGNYIMVEFVLKNTQLAG